MASSRPWIFLCPSSRGIGHALTRHLLQHTHPSIPILATARGDDLSSVKSSILKDLSLPSTNKQSQQDLLEKRLHLVSLDVTSESSIQAASERASFLFPKQTHHLHLAFALPGILYPEKSWSGIDYEHAVETYKVNVLGPMLLMKYFADFMPKKSTTFARTADDGAEVITSIRSEEEEEVDKNLPSTAQGAGSAGGYGGEGEPASHLHHNEKGKGKEKGQQEIIDKNHPPSTTGDKQKGGEKETMMSLPPSAIWTTMSARVGSISDNRLGGWYSYRSSKAAVNSLTKSLDHELRAKRDSKAMAVAYHPGTVKTGLSREFWGSVANDSLFTPQDAASKMAGVVFGLRAGQRGRCWDWKGSEIHP
ncbi:short-chain dehydrogenase [Rhypophila decipiens]